ncbi:hypothetical protein T261_1564 [Streptomyces lydicus]|nr:hypothetical protein T261_1564 [Streptomyces lydicus]
MIDTEGRRKLSRRGANDETALLKLIADVLAMGRGPADRQRAADHRCQGRLRHRGPGPDAPRAKA